nr:hypothetical protein [Kofleriaceae bacterium]
MITPLMVIIVSVLFVAIAVAASLYLSRITVTPYEPMPMAHRIPFPKLHLGDPDHAIAQLDEPDEVVIPHVKALLVIKYPLSVPASIEVSSSVEFGFTRRELVQAICDSYAHVYEAEEATALTKPLALEERTANQRRNRTDGLYGIWGYDLSDLLLVATHWSRRYDGVVVIDLQVKTKYM